MVTICCVESLAQSSFLVVFFEMVLPLMASNSRLMCSILYLPFSSPDCATIMSSDLGNLMRYSISAILFVQMGPCPSNTLPNLIANKLLFVARTWSSPEVGAPSSPNQTFRIASLAMPVFQSRSRRPRCCCNLP